MGDATICGQGRKIEQLTGTGGTHPEKALKTGQVADVEQAPNIALQVGLDVIGEPDRGRYALDPYAWSRLAKAARPE